MRESCPKVNPGHWLGGTAGKSRIFKSGGGDLFWHTADLSANSGNNALTRDPSFTADFLRRHHEKLIFGSDCWCTDGHGGGSSAAGNAATRLQGKCVARETLSVLKANSDARLFRTIVWENGHRVFKLPSQA